MGCVCSNVDVLEKTRIFSELESRSFDGRLNAILGITGC